MCGIHLIVLVGVQKVFSASGMLKNHMESKGMENDLETGTV